MNAMMANSPNQHLNFADLEMFGNPRYMTYSQQGGTTTLSSTTLASLTSTAGLVAGQAISGTGIPADTYIQAISDATTIIMTKAATGAGTNTMTFAVGGTSYKANPQPTQSSTVSMDLSGCQGVAFYTSFYKVRTRGSINSQTRIGLAAASPTYRMELGAAENTEFSGLVTFNSKSHMQNCVFKAGIIWASSSTPIDDPGMGNCQIASTASFNYVGSGTAPLRMDPFTSYYFKTAGALLGSAAYKLILDDSTNAAVNLTAQIATIGTTTLFTPATDGVYQISVYTSTTTAGTPATDTLTVTVGWKDDTTTQALALSAIQLGTLGAYTQQTIIAKCKASQPITYAAAMTGTAGSPQYALYVSVMNIV
jgi:hypothetical protein